MKVMIECDLFETMPEHVPSIFSNTEVSINTYIIIIYINSAELVNVKWIWNYSCSQAEYERLI